MGGDRSSPFRGIRGVAAGAVAVALASVPALAADGASLFHLGPENIGAPGTYSHQIDDLYRLILWIVLVTFALTEGLLLWFLVRFRATPGGKAVYTHGNHRLEVIWTVVPAAILVFLAFHQFGTWREAKIARPDPKEGLVVQVMAKQFEWHFRYAGPDGKFGTADDVITQILRVPEDVNVTVQLRTQDVLHSFFIPYLRLKQDTVPGLTINQWFRVARGKTTEEARRARNDPKFDYEIACAELCGVGHTKMRGVLAVDTREGFFRWLDGKYTTEVLGFDNSEKLINRFWPKTENRLQDPWLRAEWPADLKAKWPK